MTKRTAHAVTITGPREVGIASAPARPPAADEVVIETLASGISAGTELNVYRGDAPQWRMKHDARTNLFRAGAGAEWEYPLVYGYANVGRVVERGPGVSDLGAGAPVFSYAPHASTVTVPRGAVVPLSEGSDPEAAVMFASVNTAMNGVLDARPAIGETLVVSGLGVIGQIVVRLLSRLGPERLVAVDRITARRGLAQQGGATDVLDPAADSVAEAVRDMTGGRGADRVLEVSGAAPALHEAIRTVGVEGMVVAMSWYGGGAESLSLAGEFHHNRVTVRSSQVARIDPALAPLWTVERRQARARDMLGTLALGALISHRIPLAEAASAYRLLDETPETAMQVVLTYGRE